MAEEDDAALFAQFAGDVRPIGQPPRVQQRAATKPRPTPVARPAVVVAMEERVDTALASPSPWTLVRAGVSRERLRRLGKARADHLLDLHGKSRDQALRLLQQVITQARREGGRVVEVVHGRGLHSSDGVPVLKQAVYHWLGHGPCSGWVLAVIPKPESGGGACLILLRREKAAARD